MKTDFYTIQNLLLLTMIVLLYFLAIRLLHSVQKRIESTGRILKSLKKIKSSEDFEKAYHEIKKSDQSIFLYLAWCLRFTDRLEEIQKEVLSNEGKQENDLKDEHFEDLLYKTEGMIKFFSSVCKYLSQEEQALLNSITDQKLGISIFKGPFDL